MRKDCQHLLFMKLKKIFWLQRKKKLLLRRKRNDFLHVIMSGVRQRLLVFGVPRKGNKLLVTLIGMLDYFRKYNSKYLCTKIYSYI